MSVNNLKKISWDYDEELYSIIKNYNLNFNVNKYSQYQGEEKFYVSSWEKHVLNSFPRFIISSDKLKLVHTPENIMKCFQEEDFLSALVLIILWGTMVRTKNNIYTIGLKSLFKTLESAHNLIKSDGDIKNAWLLIRQKLKWSNVILSKYLHFAVRSSGYINPPVPIDNLIIRYQFLPDLKYYIKKKYPDYKLMNWFDKDNSWQSYNSYMTVILALANRYKVNTTKIENALFGFYYNK